MQALKLANDLKGLGQLAEEGVEGVFDLVEAMHHNVLTLGGLLSLGKQKTNRTSGLTGLIYKTIRKTSVLSFKGVNLAVATFHPLLPKPIAQKWEGKVRNQWLSALNGVLGDHLLATDNPLQIEMQLMYQGRVINAKEAAVLMDGHQGDSLLLVHGLCMNDEMWTHEGHEHGEVLAKERNLLPFYLRYNSGKAIHQNGQQLSALLEAIAQHRTGNNQLNLLCHSMGGLVSRSALHHAVDAGFDWHNHVNKVVFLGTPHQGAALEKAGHVLDYLLSISPYSAPFAKLTRSRSQGIKDLQYGRISAVSNADSAPQSLADTIEFHAIAGSRPKAKQDSKHIEQQRTVIKQANATITNVKGDGLVSVASALGLHKNEAKHIGFKSEHQWLIRDCDHMALLGIKASDVLAQIWCDKH